MGRSHKKAAGLTRVRVGETVAFRNFQFERHSVDRWTTNSQIFFMKMPHWDQF